MQISRGVATQGFSEFSKIKKKENSDAPMNVTEHERRLWQLQHERRLKKAEYNRQVRAKQRVVRPRTNPAKQGGTIGLQTETIALQSETIGQQGEISSSLSSSTSTTSSLSSRAIVTGKQIGRAHV